MKNSKLASLLSKLSQKEFKEFGKFVKSPYFNTNSNILKLYDLIAKYFPDFENENLTKENIYKKIYPGEKYNDSTSRGLLFLALKLGEQFLAVERVKQKKNIYQELLLTELNERQIYDLFNIHLKTTRNELDKVENKDDEYFFLKYRVETLKSIIDSKAFIPLTQKDIPGDIQTEDTDNLINYFLTSILAKYNYLMTKTGSLNVSLNLKFLDEIIEYLKKTDLTEVPLLNYQYNRLMMYKSGMEDKYFFTLKKILYDDFDRLSRTEKYNLFGTLQNFCVKKDKISGKDSEVTQFELYKFAMDNDILTYDDKEPLHHMIFFNVVSCAIYNNKVEEAKEFIEKYKNRLAPSRADSAVNFNMAKIYFKEREYNKAIESLALVHNDDVFYKVFVKHLYAMVYYENENFDELILLLDAYKSFLNSNNVLSAKMRADHLEFVLFLSRLTKLKEIPDKDELEYLKHEVKKSKAILGNEWLVRRIDDLL